MTPAELIDAVERAGGRLELEGDQIRLRGAVPDELRRDLRAQRDAVRAELGRRPAADRQRWGRVPPEDAPLRGAGLELAPAWARQLEAHVLRQPRAVHAFVLRRASQYFARGAAPAECDWRACVDVIAWQRLNTGLEAARFIVTLPSREELGLENKPNEHGANEQSGGAGAAGGEPGAAGQDAARDPAVPDGPRIEAGPRAARGAPAPAREG